MNGYRKCRIVVLLGFALSLAGGLFAQALPDKQVDRQLIVNGKTMSAAVRQIDGHFYVDLETLAQITNGIGYARAGPNRIDNTRLEGWLRRFTIRAGGRRA